MEHGRSVGPGPRETGAPLRSDAASGTRRVEKEHTEGCLVCGAPLVYLTAEKPMACVICQRTLPSTAHCENGHFVCNDCHRKGLDQITAICLASTARAPAEILEEMMDAPFCHMHGPEHHVMVGAALLTAYRNAGGEIDLKAALTKMLERGRAVPGGVCGFWGACGAAISTGIFLSILTDSTPLSVEAFALANKMTARALERIGAVGGPRCCKRDSYLSLEEAIEFVRQRFGVEMERRQIRCRYSAKNRQCIGKRCPYHRAYAEQG